MRRPDLEMHTGQYCWSDAAVVLTQMVIDSFSTSMRQYADCGPSLHPQ
jgi:hypothetical protein